MFRVTYLDELTDQEIASYTVDTDIRVHAAVEAAEGFKADGLHREYKNQYIQEITEL